MNQEHTCKKNGNTIMFRHLVIENYFQFNNVIIIKTRREGLYSRNLKKSFFVDFLLSDWTEKQIDTIRGFIDSGELVNIKFYINYKLGQGKYLGVCQEFQSMS